MKNLINYLSKKSLSLGSGSGMDAKWKQNPFMRFAVVLTLIFTIGSGNAWGDELYFEGWESHNNGGATNNFGAGPKTYGDFSFAYADAAGTGSPLTGSYHAILRVAKNTTNSPSLISGALLSSDETITKVSWKCKGFSGCTLKVSYSTDGSTWTEKFSSTISTTAQDKYFTISPGITGPIYLKFIVSVSSSNKNNRDANIDNITIEGTSSGGSTPSVTPDPTSLSWGTVLQGSSQGNKTISITGANLTAGTLTISATGGYSVTPTSKSVSGTLDATTLTVTPPSTSTTGAKNGKVTISGGGLASNVEVDLSMTVNAASTVTWMVNGSEYTTTLVANGSKPECPSNPSSCDGTSTIFVGWTPTPWSGKLDDVSAKTIYTSGSAMPDVSGPVTYHAVFAKASGSGSGSFELNKDDFGSSYSSEESTLTKLSTNDIGYKQCRKNQTNNTPSGWCANGLIEIRGSNSGHGEIYNKTAISGLTTLRVYEVSGASNLTVYYGTSSKTTENSVSSPFASVTGTESVSYSRYSGSCSTSTITLNYYDVSIPSGNDYFYIYASSGTNIFKITVSYSSVSYSQYLTTCCTPLGSINGSVSWSNPTQAVVSWDNIDHVSSWTVKYKTHAAGDYSTWAGEQTVYTKSTTDDSRKVTITGLTPCTDYDFQIIANPASGYCEKDQTIEDSQTHNWTVTKTGVTNVTAASLSAIPATTCNGFGPITITAATGYALPADITVTNATKSWNSSTGALSISSVTGNVSITITPTCVSPVITADPADASYYVGDSPDALSVSATLASGTLTYLWKVSTNGGSTWSDAAGTNNAATYSGASLSTASAGTLKFKCIVGNSEGGCSVESGVATITVSNASYFPNGKTIFIQAESTSAWSDANYDCVKAWFHTAGGSETAQSTYWLFNATGGDAGKKLFATVVPATGDLPYLDIQRFTHDCSLWRNKNGGCSYSDANGSNTIRSTGNTDTYDAKDDYIRWNAMGVTMNLMSSDAWLTPVASMTDQGSGIWSGSYEYTPSNTSTEYVIATNYNGNIGNTGSNNNATLSGMVVGSTYDVTATLDIKDHSLEMSKTFVKGTVHFNLQGHGSAISDLTNVTAGSKISAPSAPSATGYTFGGWYKEPACTNAWTFASDEVNETMTLYAKWTANVYTITKTLTNVANAGLPASFTYTGATTTALNSTFTVDATNFFLPSSIAVTMGGTPLTPGTDYTYNNSTGAFTFSAVITGNIVITATATAKLKSIAITTQPTTRAYLAGETFSKTGAVVTATMGDGTTKAVTASATWTPSGTLSAGTSQTVTATYTEAGIEKTATTTINVYSVTVQKYDETPAEITNPGVTASASGRTLLQSVGSTKYVFNNWSLITASGMSISTNSLTGTPTGNVVVRANFYKPVVITWLKGGDEYSTGGPTTEVARGAQWKDLTLPTAPADNSLGACADKFMGWSNTMAEEWVKEDTHTAPATLFTSVTGNTTVINAPITFRAVFATASGGSTTKTWTFSAPGSDLGYGDETSDTQDGLTWKYNAYYSTTASPAMTGIQLNNCNSSRAPSFYIPGYNSYPIESIKISASASVTFNVVSNKPVKSDSQSALASASGTSATIDCSKLSPQIQSCYIKTSGSVQVQEVEVKYSSVSYSDYVTVCCTQYDITLASSGSVTGGTFNAGGTASACEGAEVTLSATPADGYSFAGWTVTKTASPYTDITSTNVAGNTLTMPAYGVTVNASFATLTGIVVKTVPTKTTYCEGDNFDPTGLVITASFSNSTTLDIPYSGNEAKFTFSPTTAASLTTGNTSVTITYSGQSTSQAITVNGKLAVTKTGSGTVTGGTFTVDNATACVGTTINIEAAAASHYTFGSWTITKTSDGTDVTASVSIGSASSATTSFTMPAYGVTVTPTFNEDAYHTATFKNNGAVIDGYDEVKTYDGERPSAPTLTDITDACDKTDCNKFYGWIAEGDIWDETIDDVSAKIIYRTAGDLPNVSGADVVYHAVWAKGTGAPAIPNTLIAKWDKQSIAASTAIKAKDKDGNTLNSVTMTSNIAMTTSAVYGYANSSISTDPVITLAGLDFSDYSAGVITFFARGSQQALVTVEYSTDNGSSYSTDHFSDGTAKKELGYVVTVPNTTTNVKISYGSNTGNFYFGSVRAYGTQTTSYDFTELTSSNTSGWSGADWDGYYLIVGNSNTKAFRSDIMEGLYGMTTVSPSEGVISTSDLGLMFKVKYNSSTTGYAIKSAATQDYLTDDGGGVSEKYHLLETSATEAISIAYNQITHATDYYVQWATDRFGSYGSSTAPTLYKIMSSFTEFRITCCATKVNLTHNSPSNGSVAFSKTKVSTCNSDKEVTLTIAPDEGYKLTGWTVNTTTGYADAKTTSPAVATNSDAVQNITLTFAEDANKDYDVTATFGAIPVSSLSLRAQQTGQDDKVGNNLTMNCYPKEGQTGGNDPLNHTLKVLFNEVLPANALDNTYTWSVRVKTKEGDWEAIGFTGNALNTNDIINSFNKNSGTLQIKATEGTAEIKITANDASGVSAKVTITVANVALSTLNVAKSETALYVGESEEIAVTYDPINTTTKGYTTGSYTYVTIGRANDKITLTGKAATSEVTERVTLTSSDAGAKTATIDVTVKPLPIVTFEDIVHNKTDFVVPLGDGSCYTAGTGELKSTVTDGVVSHSKHTPSRAADVVVSGGNTCEQQHLHLIGWIRSDYSKVATYLAGGAKPSITDITSAGMDGDSKDYYFAAGESINVETYNGFTFYAVWAKMD